MFLCTLTVSIALMI